MRAIGRAFIVFSFAMVVGLGPAAMSAETDSAKPDAAKPPAAKSAAKPDAPLAYISVAGAPGDGEQALAAALGKRLSAAGVKTATSLAANVYSVEGIVKMTAAKGGRQAVRIDWTIFAPDGTTLGGVSQTKLVRHGSLGRKWGAAADAAARAAATTIARLISSSPPVPPKAP
jgi:hypothetical protein